MKRSLIVALAGICLAPCLHAQEAPMDATHLGLRSFVYNAFTGIQKADEMPKYPKGVLSKADLYAGTAAGIRVRGKACTDVTEARATDDTGEKIDVTCAGGGHYLLLPLSGEVQAR